MTALSYWNQTKPLLKYPAPLQGVVKSILVQQGDEVTEGAVLIELETEAQTAAATEVAAPQAQVDAAPKQDAEPVIAAAPSSATSNTAQEVDVQVPDIGVEKAVVGEILVQVGDAIDVDQSIIVVESDKATVEVPSTVSGTVTAIQINTGDTVKEGVVILKVKTAAAAVTQVETPQVASAEAAAATASAATASAPQTTASAQVEVAVPDLGVDKATVAEILVQVGDTVAADQSLIVVESDKATVEVPSTTAGVIQAIHVELGQSVAQGNALVTIVTASAAAPTAVAAAQVASAPSTSPAVSAASTAQTTTVAASAHTNVDKLSKAQHEANAKVYAGPAVRKLARELGVVLADVKPAGPHARVLKEDLKAYVKARLTAPQTAPVAATTQRVTGLPKLPDFSAFGGVEEKGLTRLQQVSIPQLSLNNYIPQVTQFDLADITELEAWRSELKANFKKEGVSLTILAFIAKAVAHLLKDEPYFAAHSGRRSKVCAAA